MFWSYICLASLFVWLELAVFPKDVIDGTGKGRDMMVYIYVV